MKLGFVLLDNVVNVNDFDEVGEQSIVRGNPVDLFMRIVTIRETTEGKEMQRYIPASGASLKVDFNHVDSNKAKTQSAAEAFAADDRSIWKVTVANTDRLQFTPIQATLTEGSKDTKLLQLSDLTSLDTDNDKFFA